MKPARLLCLLPILLTTMAQACSLIRPDIQFLVGMKPLVIYGQFDGTQDNKFVLQRSINGNVPVGRYQIKQAPAVSCPGMLPLEPGASALTTEPPLANITVPVNGSAGDHYYVFVMHNASDELQLAGENELALVRVHQQQIITLRPPTPDNQQALQFYKEGDQLLQTGYWTTDQQSFDKWLTGNGPLPKWRFVKKPTRSN